MGQQKKTRETMEIESIGETMKIERTRETLRKLDLGGYNITCNS